MEQFLLHLFGDYIVQNDWMGLNKKKRTWMGELACQIHCITYSLPFILICSWWAVLVIYVTHYIIDRTDIVAWFLAYRNGAKNIENFGFTTVRPQIISVWLWIIVDNVFHIFCNYFAIKYL